MQRERPEHCSALVYSAPGIEPGSSDPQVWKPFAYYYAISSASDMAEFFIDWFLEKNKKKWKGEFVMKSYSFLRR